MTYLGGLHTLFGCIGPCVKLEQVQYADVHVVDGRPEDDVDARREIDVVRKIINYCKRPEFVICFTSFGVKPTQKFHRIRNMHSKSSEELRVTSALADPVRPLQKQKPE